MFIKNCIKAQLKTRQIFYILEKRKKDITTIDDIILMVDTFKEILVKEKELYAVYKKLAKLDVKLTKPVLYSFWNKIIFSKGKFSKKPFQYRMPLKIEPAIYEKFIILHNNNVDTHFEGKNAELVKSRIIAIADLYQTKLAYRKPIKKRRTKAELNKIKNEDNL